MFGFIKFAAGDSLSGSNHAQLSLGVVVSMLAWALPAQAQDAVCTDPATGVVVPAQVTSAASAAGNQVMCGNSAVANADGGIAVGSSATANGLNAIAMGTNSVAQFRAVSIGLGAAANQTGPLEGGGIALGFDAGASLTASADGAASDGGVFIGLRAGYQSNGYRDLFIGAHSGRAS